jgi:endonuclease/exonuclease/phosphatase family metal-dependent hydrolase
MVNRIFRWLNVLLILLTLLSYLSPYVNPQTFWPISLLGLAYPWLLLLNLLFAIGWGLQRKRYAFMSLACIVAGIGHLTNFIGFDLSESAVHPGSIPVLSYNIYGFRGLPTGENGRGADTADFWAFLEETGPIDIICLQEAKEHHTEEFVDVLKYPHHFQYAGRGTSILSKYPIRNKGKIEFPESNNSCLWADVDINGKVIRVYNVHLQSNFISNEAGRLAREGDLQESETWKGIRGILGKYRRFAAMRVEQAERVASHIKGSPHPVLVCGDFNDTPLSKAYRILSSGLVDGFQQKGRGLGTTYGGIIPSLRIDYILSDPRLQVIDYRIFHESFSDHYPILCQFDIKE